MRSELRLVTAQRDLTEENCGLSSTHCSAPSEARHVDQLVLFNEAEALATTTDSPAREDVLALASAYTTWSSSHGMMPKRRPNFIMYG